MAGHGLVFNVGERIEGFTSSAWLTLLILWHAIGLDFISVSRIVGFVFGAGVVVLTFGVTRRLVGLGSSAVAFMAAALVGTSLPLAYWSSAGLETALFVFLFNLSILLFLRRSYLLVAALAALVWTRPEAPLVIVLLLLIELILERRLPRFMLRCVAAALALSVPGLAFRVLYYHSLFPNPYYAKVAFDMVQLTNGFHYVAQFFRDNAFLGIGLLVPIMSWRRFSNDVRSIWLLTVGYSAYVVLIGGDTLKIDRFFLPLLSPLAVLTALSVWTLIDKARPVIRNVIILGLTFLFCIIGYALPWREVQASNELEKSLVYNMSKIYAHIRQCDSTRFSVAVSTIGVFGYHASDHRIIDMLGLTDSTVARHPQELPVGHASTWKERRFNAEYILSQEPDYIVFSTGIKPSAPAERALLRYPQFLESYRAVLFSSYLYPDTNTPVLDVAFKRVRPVTGHLEPTYPLEFVEKFVEAENFVSGENYAAALIAYDAAINACGEQKPFADLLYNKAMCFVNLGRGGDAYRLLNKVLEQDSLAVGAHRDLYLTELHFGNVEKAAVHRSYIEALTPCELPILDSMALAVRQAQ